jgi:hypothetical protein
MLKTVKVTSKQFRAYLAESKPICPPTIDYNAAKVAKVLGDPTCTFKGSSAVLHAWVFEDMCSFFQEIDFRLKSVKIG